MSHFLDRLVERACGTAARVEPLVTPRFAPTPIVEIASEVEPPHPAQPDQRWTEKEKSSRRALARQEVPADKAEPKIIRESENSSPPQQPEKLLIPMETSAVESTIFVRPSPSANRPVPAAKNGTARKHSFTTSQSKRPRPAAPRARTSWSFERDLVTPNESPEQPTIVRVTIGRIDVRATTPAVPSRKSSPRSEPKLTLDAYLKSRREGT